MRKPQHAVGRAHTLDLDHCALSRLISQVECLGDDAVDTIAHPIEPALRDHRIAGGLGCTDPLAAHRQQL